MQAWDQWIWNSPDGQVDQVGFMLENKDVSLERLKYRGSIPFGPKNGCDPSDPKCLVDPASAHGEMHLIKSLN